MNKNSIQRFELGDLLLQYNYESYTLLCRSAQDGRNLWIRKIEDGGHILDILADNDRIYLSLVSGEQTGQFITLRRTDGSICWFIPGRSYMFRVFLDSIYLIFIDEKSDFFLIKVSAFDGKKIWHHNISDGLSEYTINTEKVILKYNDGSIEVLNNNTGLSAG